ncbi:MAG: hypothetical protein IJJ26_03090 [Victivallales bacterium]|nr:hypothetical protein [Victivallales bacterium]
MYIDAGTGSMLLQAGAAVFFTVVLFFRQIWNWCKSLGKNTPQESHDVL